MSEMEQHPSFRRRMAMGLLKTFAETVLKLAAAGLAIWLFLTFGVKHHG
jgi:hypothetical protein